MVTNRKYFSKMYLSTILAIPILFNFYFVLVKFDIRKRKKKAQ